MEYKHQGYHHAHVDQEVMVSGDPWPKRSLGVVVLPDVFSLLPFDVAGLVHQVLLCVSLLIHFVV